MFSLIFAAAQQGAYQTPSKAAAFYDRLAEEVSNACRIGKLECVPQLLPELPPVTWAQLADGFLSNLGPILHLLFYQNPPLDLVVSQRRAGDAFERNLDFLNYPRHTAPVIPGFNSGTTKLSGWYRKTGAQWFTVLASELGAAVGSRIDRLPSPDIQIHFADEQASHQRFELELQCASMNCLVRFQGQDGCTAERTLNNLQAGNAFSVGEGWVHVDAVQSAPRISMTVSPLTKATGTLRAAIVSNYQYIAIPLFLIGALAFVVMTLFRLRIALANLTFLVAVTCWLGVAIRMGLLLLVDVTSFPAVRPEYLAPAYYLLVAASVLSCAALLKAWIGDRTLPQQTFRAGA